MSINLRTSIPPRSVEEIIFYPEGSCFSAFEEFKQRRLKAEALIQAALERMQAAESRIQDAESRVQDAESRAQEVERRAQAEAAARSAVEEQLRALEERLRQAGLG